MRSPEPYRQRQLGSVHHRAGRDRRLTAAVEAFGSVRPALQQRGAALTADRADKAFRPAPFEQERRAARLVEKGILELGKRSRPGHWVSPLRPSLPAAQPGWGTTFRATWDNGISVSARAQEGISQIIP